MVSGWHKDNFRHSLAARGLPSSYYSKKFAAKQVMINVEPLKEKRDDTSVKVGELQMRKESETDKALAARGIDTERSSRQRESPITILRRQKAAAALEKYESSTIKGRRDVQMALSSLDAGDYSQVINLLQSGKKVEDVVVDGQIKQQLVPLTSAERVALQTSLTAAAVKLAQGGSTVPKELLSSLDPAEQSRIKSIESVNAKAVSEQLESPLSRELKRDLPILAGEIADAPAEGLSGVSPYGGLNGQAPGVVEDINGIGKTNFVRVNAAVGNEEAGMLNPLGFLPDKRVPQLGGGSNPVLADMGKQPRRKAEIVQDQIDSLYKAREELAKADLSAYDKGNEAFAKGNREQLIAAISELQTEEAKLRDRWELIGQTHRNMQSIENQTTAFQKPDGNNPLWGIGEQGGQQLADQTTKMNKVREGVIKANNKVFARKRMLQFRLQRLDSSVPPETSIPHRVQRLEKQEKSFVQTIDNPVLDTFSKEAVR